MRCKKVNQGDTFEVGDVIWDSYPDDPIILILGQSCLRYLDGQIVVESPPENTTFKEGRNISKNFDRPQDTERQVVVYRKAKRRKA